MPLVYDLDGQARPSEPAGWPAPRRAACLPASSPSPFTLQPCDPQAAPSLRAGPSPESWLLPPAPPLPVFSALPVLGGATPSTPLQAQLVPAAGSPPSPVRMPVPALIHCLGMNLCV